MSRLLIVLACVTHGLTGCSPPQTAPASSRAAEYVGRQACAKCHAAQHEAWQGSHHDLAMQEATEASVLGDFDDATFTYNGVTSTFFERDGAHFARTDGPDGQLKEYEIAYAFGVEPLQQYLIEFPDGRLQVLGISWDTRPAADGGQRWFHQYPDEPIDHEDPLHWTGPHQNWNFMCAECHSTRVRKGYDAERDRFETTWFEIDVSCEACHGPGSIHVAWGEAQERRHRTFAGSVSDTGLAVGLKDTDGGAWLMNTETAIAERMPPRTSNVELETCARCHSRRALISEDYVHGKPLLDTHRLAFLTEDLYHADGQILGEVYVYGSFLQSKMHAAGVTCRDCHDPHSLKLLGSGDSTCARCHLPEKFFTPEHHLHAPDSTGASCIACHMPKQDYMVVDPRGDHSFRVPRPDLSIKLGSPNACAGCHADKTNEWAAGKLAQRYGEKTEAHYGETLLAGRGARPGADARRAALIEDETQPVIARATALTQLRTAESGPVIHKSLEEGDPLIRLAALRAMEMFEPASRPRSVISLLDDPIRSVRTEAAKLLAPTRGQSLTADQRERLDTVLDEYRQIQTLNADRAESHLNLGLLHLDLGQADRAEAEYRQAIATESSFLPAYVNLADLYRTQGDDVEGESVLRDALSIAPDNAEVHHALGLALVRQERPKEALEFLYRACELRPEEARYVYVYGVGLHSTGQTDQALTVLDTGHDRHPGDRDLLVALATINRDTGRIEAAIAYAERLVRLAPQDPQAGQLLRQLQDRRRP
jgi:tetratricopeptide (TPR) repeat protein